MSSKSDSMVHPGDRILDTASEWYARLHSSDCTPSERDAFQSWLAESDEHGRAYRQVQSLSRKMDELSGLSKIVPESLPPGLRSEYEDARRDARRMRERRGNRRVRRRAAVLAAGLAVALLFAGLWVVLRDEPAQASMHVTPIGGQQEIRLADGSLVNLNTDTALSVVMKPSVREVHLARGEAYFEVASDPRREFRVFAGAGVVRVKGTAFNIRHRSGAMSVTVFEGVVSVEPGVSASGSGKAETSVPREELGANHVLGVGEQIRISDSSLVVRRLASNDLVNSQAWRNGKLVFVGATLAEVVDEFRLYIPERIVFVDENIAAFKVGGVFDTDNADSLFSALEVALPVEVVRDPRGYLLKSADPSESS